MNLFRVQPPLSGGIKARILIGIGIPILFLAGAGVWYGLMRGKVTSPTTTNTPGSSTSANTTAADEAPLLVPPDVNAQTADADRDGLSDSEEDTLGTKKEAADTDEDGLSDRAEVRTFHTDPLRTDTDGDGTPDGVEVRQGDNPKGEGKLLDTAAAINAAS